MLKLIPSKEYILNSLNEWLATPLKPIHESRYLTVYGNRQPLQFITVNGNTMTISVQASSTHYSSPREDNADKYSEVEVGYPSWIFSNKAITKYAEDDENPKETIYAYMSVEALANEIYRAYMEL